MILSISLLLNLGGPVKLSRTQQKNTCAFEGVLRF